MPRLKAPPLGNTLIVVIIFTAIILAVIIAYRKRIKAGIKALGAELSIEAEGRSESVSPAPPAAAAEAAPPAERAVTAHGDRSRSWWQCRRGDDCHRLR